MMMNLLNKIKNLIKFGTVTNIDDDTGSLPLSQVQFFNKVKDVVTIYPYGFSANAPLDNLAVVMNVGHSDNTVAFPFSGGDRHKNLKSGEVIVSNYSTGSIIKFSQNGDIIIDCKNDINVTVDGNSNHTISGDKTESISGNESNTISGDLSQTITGTTTIDSTGNVSLTSPLTTITGNLVVTGTISGASVAAGGSSMSASGDMTAAGVVSGDSISTSGSITGGSITTDGGKDLDTHTHPGVTPGGGSTGPPN